MNTMSYVTDNWYWIVTAAASGGMLLWQQLQNSGAGVSPTEAVQLIEKQLAKSPRRGPKTEPDAEEAAA